MAAVRASHIGIDGCIRKARDTLYWPRMSAELKEYISCNICLAHRTSPGKEPLLQYDIIEQPWAKVGVDLCELHARTLLVVIEVERINKANTMGVSKALKVLFSRYGVPEVVVLDNGPQFASVEFGAFKHITSPVEWQSGKCNEEIIQKMSRFWPVRIPCPP